MSEYQGQQPQQPQPQQPQPQQPWPEQPQAPQPQQPGQPPGGWQQPPPAQPGQPAQHTQQWQAPATPPTAGVPQPPGPPPAQAPPGTPGTVGAPRAFQTGPIPPGAVAQAQNKASMFTDPSELAATGLIAAVLFAIVAGLINFFGDVGFGGFSTRLLQLTATVDVGDIALLGIATALLLLTPDPPGGMGRPMLLNVTAALAAIISAYGIIRAVVLFTDAGDILHRFAGFVATTGVSLAAATVAFYAAKESFLKKAGAGPPTV